jgi:vacuolar-type H+-ATPase subunit C/Vma6
MEGFEFGNARVRAMKSRLLSVAQLSALLACDKLPALVLALAETPYREAVEASLLRQQGMACINDALQRDLVATLGKLPGFYEGETRHLLELALGKYEIHNVTTILRGIEQEAAASETAVLLLPIGELRSDDLRLLARSADLRTAIGLLATWRSPLALPLLNATAARPRAGLPFLELALTCWYYTAVAAEAETAGKSWRTTMRLETDIANLLTALRLTGHPEALARLEEGGSTGRSLSALEQLFCGEGYLSKDLLLQIARQPTLTAAVTLLNDTRYSDVLAPTVAGRETPLRVSDLEHDLLIYQLKIAAALFTADALGLGVPLGYIRMKTAETMNIRLIAQGVALEMDKTWLRAQLLLQPQQQKELRPFSSTLQGST